MSVQHMTHDDVTGALSRLVEDGLLEMGVNDEGEAVFWATDRGVEELEMKVPVPRIG